MDLHIEKGPSGRIRRLRELLAAMTRDDVEAVLSNFSIEAAALHGYAESTDFDLVYDGQRYPPKAVLGLATERVIGRALNSDEFSGGAKSPCFVILAGLGFEIARKTSIDLEAIELPRVERFESYDRNDIAQIFEPGVQFIRGAGRWGIQGIVESPRDSGNFVFMVTLGKAVEGNPYEDALTADGHLIWESQTQQNFDSKAIKKLLVHDPEERNIHLFLRPKENAKYTYLGLLEYFSHDPNTTNPVHFNWKIRNWDLSPDDLRGLNLPARPSLDPAYSPAEPLDPARRLELVASPPQVRTSNDAIKKNRTRTVSDSPVDWAERDLRNRQLGLQGEKLVLNHEIETLRAAGRLDLAERVRHEALYNSAAGFDISSFHPDGSPKRIEVKTTQGPASTSFYISINEVLASRDDADSYVIYRVFGLRTGSDQICFYELPGDVETSCNLVPVNFRASPGGREE